MTSRTCALVLHAEGRARQGFVDKEGVGPYDTWVVSEPRAWGSVFRMGIFKKIDLSPMIAAARQLELDGRVDLPPFGAYTFPRPAVVTVVIRALGGGVEVRGTIDARFAGLCDRCLEAVERPVRIAVEERFARDDDPFGEANVLVGDHLDAEDLVRQLVDAELPLVLLCDDDCRGLCPRCGRSRNDAACTCAATVVE